jgi:DNA-binding XRE family transcriptional regulator
MTLMFEDQLEERGPRMPARTSDHKTPGLQRARVRAYLTQKALADKASIAVSTVARAEQGYAISMIATQKIADALGVSIEALHGEEPRA